MADVNEREATLLQEDCAFVVSLFDLDALSPAQLAIASLRPDLDVLVRQRAYHEFLLRRDEYEQGFGADTPQPLFDLPLNFPIPPDLASLSPSQLLLLQYDPLCASATEAADAGARFLRLAENAKVAPSPPLPPPPPPALAELPLARCTATWDDGALSEAGALALRVEDAGLTVVRDSERLFTLEATEMDEVIVDLGADGTAATGWTLVLRLAQLSTSSHLTLASAAVRLELGATPSMDEGYKLLQSTVASWSAKYTFEVKIIRFFARQIAFLRALAPEESLEIPVFTPRELELLSYTPDPRELPVLPRECEPIFGPTHRPTERLALESLYRHAGRVNLTVIRLVLLTDAYPRLRAYVRLRAKLVEARDCLALAYGTVLRRRLYPRAGDPNTKDPIAKTTPLVERLRDNLSFRIEMIATSPTSLITRSRFERADIGIGPAHRFEMALRNIVAEDCAFAVSLSDLDALSPAQLAIASLRPNLDVLIRQRAYHEFLLRRDEYEQGFGADNFQPLFDLALNFPIPHDPASLSPAQLLLLQYNPLCASATEAADAGARFLRLAEEAKVVLPPPPPPEHVLAELPLAGYVVTWDGGERSEVGGLELRVEEEALTVARDGVRLFTLEAPEMDEVEYHLGADTVATDCTILVRLAQLSTSPSLTHANAVVRLMLGTPVVTGEEFAVLRSTMASWSIKYTFEAKTVSSPPPLASCPPRSDASARHERERSMERRAYALRRHSSFGEREGGRKRVRLDPDEPRIPREVWDYAGWVNSKIEWNPGIFVRQMALLRALAPDENFDVPVFTPQEVALLWYEIDLAKLPHLPPDPPEVVTNRFHRCAERLALEHMYYRLTHLGVRTTRLVLLTDEYPALRTYAQILGKIVDARDALPAAYGAVFERVVRLRIERDEPGSRELGLLLERLRDNPLYRQARLGTSQYHFVRYNDFTPAELGTQAHERFTRAMEEIVAFEDEVLEAAKGWRVGRYDDNG
ncbi:hypothetical protein JCM10450v2_007085 [Rhodotorula kratochvilovae]